jgi:ribonuclease HI
MTIEVIAVTKALSWFEKQAFTNACILSDSISMLRKIQAGRRRRKGLESKTVRFGKYICHFCSMPCWREEK